MKQKKQFKILTKLVAVILCLCLMFTGCITGAAFFVRPATSDLEKRKLTEFPKFTMATFLNGQYFSDISIWYSDTYPMRDSLMNLSQEMKNVYGVRQKTMMVGTKKEADKIPTKKKKTKKVEPVPVPEDYSFDEDMQNQILSNLYVKNGAAYSMYYFVQDSADLYINAMNRFAKRLKGTSKVYSLLIPNNSIVLPDDELKKLGGSDMKQAINYYYKNYKNVTGIDDYSYIEKAKDQYLYFRTDHHWTALGAYQAYKAFCKEKGWKPEELDSFETNRFEPFLGTAYDQLRLPEMEANPDYVDAYIPHATNDMVYWDENGNETNYNVIADVSDWSEGSGYYCFIGGDNPLSVIKNPTKEKGKSVLLIKESFGNSFAPFLVDHYKTVYIADFRCLTMNIVDFCKENKIDDVIFENNISIIGSTQVASTYDQLSRAGE